MLNRLNWALIAGVAASFLHIAPAALRAEQDPQREQGVAQEKDAPSQPALAPSDTVTIPDGTPLTLEFVAKLSSATAKLGDKVELRITAGTFKDITGVELTTGWVRTRDDSPDRREWYVSLALPGEMTKPVLCVLSAYEPARAELVRYGNLLQVPVTDLGDVIRAGPPAREEDSDLPDLDFDMD